MIGRLKGEVYRKKVMNFTGLISLGRRRSDHYLVTTGTEKFDLGPGSGEGEMFRLACRRGCQWDVVKFLYEGHT